MGDRALFFRETAMQQQYVDVRGLAEITGISASTWNKRRLTGDTPPFVRVGKSVRYHVETAKNWLAARERRSTSDVPASPALAGA